MKIHYCDICKKRAKIETYVLYKDVIDVCSNCEEKWHNAVDKIDKMQREEYSQYVKQVKAKSHEIVQALKERQQE